MTTTGDGAAGGIPSADRSLVSSLRGLPWWGAVLIALVLTATGVVIDILRIERLGMVFTVCYAAGCLLAVCWVRRSHLFGPTVQAPLLLAVTVPAMVIGMGAVPSSGSLAGKALVVGGPLINAFPTMAATTAACLAIGLLRWRLQQVPPTPERARAQGRGRDRDRDVAAPERGPRAARSSRPDRDRERERDRDRDGEFDTESSGSRGVFPLRPRAALAEESRAPRERRRSDDDWPERPPGTASDGRRHERQGPPPVSRPRRPSDRDPPEPNPERRAEPLD